MKKFVILLAVTLLPLCYSCEIKEELELIIENFYGTGRSYWANEDNTLLIVWDDESLSYSMQFYYSGIHGQILARLGSGVSDGVLEILGYNGSYVVDYVSDNEMILTFKYYGQLGTSREEVLLELPPTRIYRVGVEVEDADVKTYAWRGFYGELRELNVEANAVTADGCSQLAVVLNDPTQELVNLQAFTSDDCKISDCNYSTEGGYWSAKLTAPNSCINNGQEISIVLLAEVLDSKGRSSLKIYTGSPIKVYKMGVGLAHGLLSNAEACFGGLLAFLKLQGYLDEQVQLIDYHDTNASSFSVNESKNVIGDSLGVMYDKLLEKGIVSSKYALVGHSMGGILSRLYVQESNVAGVGAIITLDTPHWGSHVADLGRKLLTELEELILKAGKTPETLAAMAALDVGIEVFYRNSAFNDLRSNSDAIQRLNGTSIASLYGVPVHAVCSYIDGYGAVVADEPEKITIVDKVSLLKLSKTAVFFSELDKELYKMYKTNSYDASQLILNLLFEESEHDGVVSGTSQRGGLEENYCTIERDEYKGHLGFSSNAHHCMTNKWYVTYNNIYSLLSNPLEDERFCKTGFKARIDTRSSDTDFEYIIAENPNTYVKFKTCMQEVVDNVNCIHVELEKSDDIIADMIFVKYGEDEFNVDICRDVYYLEIPQDFKGEAQLYIYGKNESRELTVDSQTLVVY